MYYLYLIVGLYVMFVMFKTKNEFMKLLLSLVSALNIGIFCVQIDLLNIFIKIFNKNIII
jgi:hypothetical protein